MHTWILVWITSLIIDVLSITIFFVQSNPMIWKTLDCFDTSCLAMTKVFTITKFLKESNTVFLQAIPVVGLVCLESRNSQYKSQIRIKIHKIEREIKRYILKIFANINYVNFASGTI